MSKQVCLSETYVEFIRILFAVVIGGSFILVTSPPFSGWFLDVWSNIQQLLILGITYVLVITSWIGYHKSTRPRPIGFPILSQWRFCVDVILLFLYYVAFALTPNYLTVLLVYAVIFSLYVIWNAIRVYEYWKETESKRHLIVRTAQAMTFAGILWVLYLFAILAPRSNPAVNFLVSGFTLAILAVLVVFRISRSKALPSQSPDLIQ